MLTYHGLQDVHFHLIFHFLMLHATSHQKKPAYLLTLNIKGQQAGWMSHLEKSTNND